MDEIKVELENRAKIVQQMLQDEGYGAKPPEWDEQVRTWDVRVKFEGMTSMVMFDLDDPLFVRVLLPNFWDVNPDQLGSALAALDLANKKTKGAKVYLNLARSDSVAVMDFLYDGTGLEGRMLVRSLQMVANAAKVYVEAFKKQLSMTLS